MMQNRKQVERVVCQIIYYLVPIGMILYCMQAVCNDSIWLDEAFSMSLVKQTLPEILYGTAIDVHPPLYYLILKLFLIVNTSSIWVAKFISFVPLIVLLVVNYTMLPKMFGRKTAFLFSIFLLSMPQIMKYSIEIRMYSWGMLTVTLCFLFCIKWLQSSRKKYLIQMTIFALLSAYLHYFAAVSIGCLYFFVIIKLIKRKEKSKIKELFFSIGFLLLLYLPWLIVLLKQIVVVKENYWIAPITVETIKEIVQFPWKVNVNQWITPILGILLLFSFIWLIKNHKEKNSTEKASLQEKLDQAYNQIKEMATKTVEATGGVKILGNNGNDTK